MIGRSTIFFLATTWASLLCGCSSRADQPGREASAEAVSASHAGGHGVATPAQGVETPSRVGQTTGEAGTAQPGSAPATPAAPGPVAVVILMLPGSGDANRGSAGVTAPAPARTYKLLLTADSRTASIEVDGQPIGSAPVQQIYPRASPQIAAPRVAVRTSPAPRLPAPRRNANAGPSLPSTRYATPESSQDPRSPPDQFLPERRESDELQMPANTLNPNGAPIID